MTHAGSHVLLDSLHLVGASGRSSLLQLHEGSRVEARNCSFEVSGPSLVPRDGAFANVSSDAVLQLGRGCALTTKDVRGCAIYVGRGGALEAHGTTFTRGATVPSRSRATSGVIERKGLGHPGAPVICLSGGRVEVRDCYLRDAVGAFLGEEVQSPAQFRRTNRGEPQDETPLLVLEQGSNATLIRTLFNGHAPYRCSTPHASAEPETEIFVSQDSRFRIRDAAPFRPFLCDHDGLAADDSGRLVSSRNLENRFRERLGAHEGLPPGEPTMNNRGYSLGGGVAREWGSFQTPGGGSGELEGLGDIPDFVGGLHRQRGRGALAQDVGVYSRAPREVYGRPGGSEGRHGGYGGGSGTAGGLGGVVIAARTSSSLACPRGYSGKCEHTERIEHILGTCGVMYRFSISRTSVEDKVAS